MHKILANSIITFTFMISDVDNCMDEMKNKIKGKDIPLKSSANSAIQEKKSLLFGNSQP